MATRPIKIAIIGDDSNLRKSLKNANKSLAGFGKNVAKVGATAGLAFAGVAAGVAVSGVKAFSAFQTGMAEVMTLLPDAGEETFGELSDQVKSFSKEFGVLPDEAIPALYSALSAGVPKDNVFEFMEVAQKAAKGGVTELETAVDGISSVVNAYGSEVIGATEASDLMFTAVRLHVPGGPHRRCPRGQLQVDHRRPGKPDRRRYAHRRGRHPDEGRHGRVGQGGHQGRPGVP